MSLETAFSAGTPIAASKMPIPGVGDLPAFAKNNPVLCFDNLSTIGAPTGINDVATRGDLTDRTIVVRLARRLSGARMPKFGRRSRLLTPAFWPRCSIWSRWACAGTKTFGGRGGGSRAWQTLRCGGSQWRRRSAGAQRISTAPIGQTEMRRSRRRLRMTRSPHTFLACYKGGRRNRGWVQQSNCGQGSIAGEAARAMNFPQSSVALGRALRRIEPALAARGVTMERERVTAGTRISLRVKDSGPEVVPLVAA